MNYNCYSNMKLPIIALVIFVVGVSAETPVQKCPQGKTPQEYKQVIQVGNCIKHPCKLQKKTIVETEFKFTPDRKINTLKNSVNAIIAGIPLPFIGVDGTDACLQLFEADGTTKTTCPLKPGVEYVYKNHFDILEFYPRLKVLVHWGLTADDGKDVMCFEVPARITN